MIESLPLIVWPPTSLLTILIYHRVHDAPSKIYPDEIDAMRFEQQMAYIARHFSVLPLRDAVQMLRERRLPRRACCITFDDGYADNLTVALPILEKYSMPATIFVATAYVDGGCMFNDAVIDAITRTEMPMLDLVKYGLGRCKIDSLTSRRSVIDKILWEIRFHPPKQRNKFLDDLSRVSGIDSFPRNLMLTKEQVKELSRRGVEIGGHTDSHPILTSIDSIQVRKEIVKGREILEEWIGCPVRCFAYPNGLPGRDFSPEHVKIVRDLGFDLAVTTAKGIASCRSDAFQLPRFMPWGDSMFKLGARMGRKAWDRVLTV